MQEQAVSNSLCSDNLTACSNVCLRNFKFL